MIHYHLNYLVNKLDDKIDRVAREADIRLNLRSTLETLIIYDMDPQVKEQITSAINAMSARCDEHRLFIGVIGESSSGKSTFINALVEEELLESDIIIGTTAVPTMLTGRDSFDIIARLKDGWQVSFIDSRYNFSSNFYSVKEQIATFIHYLTADPNASTHVYDVTIYKPYVKILSRDIVLMDTPGISDIGEHRDIAMRAIKQHCDGAIIVIDMFNPLSSTLTRFIKESTKEILENTIFVLTRVDRVCDEREVERLVKHLQEKIKNEFGSKAPIVEPCAPYHVVENLAHPEVSNKYVEQFDDLRLKVKSYFHDRKKWIKNFNEISNLLPIYNDSIKALEKAEQDYNDEIHDLRKNPIKNLREFKTEERKRQATNFPEVDYNNNIRPMILLSANRTAEAVKELMENASSGKELETMLATDIERYCISENQKILEVFRDIEIEIERMRDNKWQQFKHNFEQEYPQLVANQMPFETVNDQGILAIKLSDCKSKLTNDIKDMVNKGVVPGDLISKIKSVFVKPKIEEYRKKYLPITETALNDYYNRVLQSVEASVDNSINNANRHLSDAFRANYDIYEEQIQKRIEERKNRLEYLIDKSNAVRHDITELQQKEQNLRNLKEVMIAIK